MMVCLRIEDYGVFPFQNAGQIPLNSLGPVICILVLLSCSFLVIEKIDPSYLLPLECKVFNKNAI